MRRYLLIAVASVLSLFVATSAAQAVVVGRVREHVRSNALQRPGLRVVADHIRIALHRLACRLAGIAGGGRAAGGRRD